MRLIVYLLFFATFLYLPGSFCGENSFLNTSHKGSKIKGIMYSKTNPSVLIGGASYHLGDSIGNAKLIKISPGSIIIEFGGEEECYHVGEQLDSKIAFSPSTKEEKEAALSDRLFDSINVKINPMVELDFKSKAEVYALRKSYVLRHPELAPSDYEPSDAIFGQIVDGKPWWGILGYCYYASSARSIEGPSEETRFLCNPFLLVGLNERYAHKAHDFKENEIEPEGYYPKPLRLVWSRSRKFARVEYDLTSFDKKNPCRDWKEKHELELIAYNARDLGFNYLCVDENLSDNVEFVKAINLPCLIPSFIHCGPSCGYPGGCNNMSKTTDNSIVIIKSLPAKVYIKLWWEKPQNCAQEPDMVFVIEMF